MINFLNEHFMALSALFILTLLIISEWKSNPPQKLITVSKPFKDQKSSTTMPTWAKIIIVMQGLTLIFSILIYFEL